MEIGTDYKLCSALTLQHTAHCQSTHHNGTRLQCPSILVHKAAEWKASGAVVFILSLNECVIAPDHWHVVNDPRVHVRLFYSLPKELQVLIRGSSVLLLAHNRANFIFIKGELG